MNKNQFLWGASTSAFQAEGAYLEDGKGLGTVDVRVVPEGIADTKIASDHYHHFEEDLLAMKELGLNVYRFSFSWSRIMPDGHTVNEKGLAFYDKIIDRCLEYGIEPLPTLYHFEMPQALVDKEGGWLSKSTIEAYASYAKTCFEQFKGKVKTWVTINEQLIASAASDLHGIHAQSEEESMKNMYQISFNMSIAEKKAMQILKQIDPESKIGPVCSIQIVYPNSCDPKDICASYDAEEMMMYSLLDMSVFGHYPKRYTSYLKERGWLPSVSKEEENLLKSIRPDFIGINYYFPLTVKAPGKDHDFSKLPPFWRSTLFEVTDNPYLEKSEWMPNGMDPMGLYLGIRKLYDRYRLPLIITENGMAYSDRLEDGKIHDSYRIDYLDAHIQKIKQAVEEGYPVFGYCPWSLIDLVSSHQGFGKRYGLIYVDRTDTDEKECARIPKDSYYWYRERIKKGL
ncbi:glycoside hydrolase family 1 protein [Dubosiella newyorkensis]|jgi:beta-glucosidase/6-phospho-beta-glucosidase/beta-galactosidase|uniref:glycoside hydrolase family 1 protein n=2 Tax=Dubosiella newyorkensis TaxID=1862672 RepID=UPI0023557586|nr:glycoside hydrolase family 1 protein [Dubosiella newyorkensis]MCI9041481.1 glycoside hydrolase family 1 protein [Dubosiella newyorkensis]